MQVTPSSYVKLGNILALSVLSYYIILYYIISTVNIIVSMDDFPNIQPGMVFLKCWGASHKSSMT